ncbi:MAG: hypothetical protein JXA22_03540 [Candidatus Thermoplasmatota archaeon]|nr:hypothetical protein [Candidatus Thermoplasmatota archaeon]
MLDEEKGQRDGIDLVVRASPISGSGIARVHISILEMEEFNEGKVALFIHEEKNVVLRLVGDSMMTRGRVSLRKKDMKYLGVKEGEKVTLFPRRKIGDRIKKGLRILIRWDDQA